MQIDKNKIRIVATGDSMTETFGEGMPILAVALKKQWPDKTFEMINHGVGGTRVGYGLWRLNNEYKVKGKICSPLLSLNPNIVLLESFAYNNATDGLNNMGLNHFKDMHTKIVERLRQETHAIIIFVVTFAPDLDHFLESVPVFYNTPLPIRRKMAEERIVYLKEAIKLAKELNLPLANVYQTSLENAKKGIPLSENINPDDWIHPSETGLKLVSEEIVKTLFKETII